MRPFTKRTGESDLELKSCSDALAPLPSRGPTCAQAHLPEPSWRLGKEEERAGSSDTAGSPKCDDLPQFTSPDKKDARGQARALVT